jgi:biotin-(acetyl-CoA carboxylase) ligase
VGIGINLTSAPDGAAQLDEPREAVFARLRPKVKSWAAAADDIVIARWRELSVTLGRRVRIDVSGQVTEGVAQDVGARGELIVDGTSFVAGSLTHL